MSDLATEQDGSVVDAADAINRLYSTPTIETPAERPRGADGKFLPTKPKADDAPIPLTPQDGSDDPDEAEDGATPKPKAKPEEAEDEGSDEEGREEDVDEEEEAPAKRYDPAKHGKIVVPVKVDGIEQDLPLDEIAKGYSRTADYTRKTQAVAEEKKRFEAEIATPLREERTYYAERIGAIEEAIAALLPTQEPDWHALRNTLPPEDFQKAWVEWDANSKRLAVVKAERERVAQLQEADADRRFQAKLAEEHEKLKAALPDFADAEKGKALKDDLTAYAKSLTFSDDDLAGVTDHRVLVLLNKARLYDQSQRNKPKIEEKVDRVLESVKPSNAKPKPKLSEVERAKARLADTGRVEDAAWLINQRLAGKR